jgi:hypothetical protein
MLKLNENHYRGIMLGCGVLLLGLGAAKGLFHLELGERADTWLSNGLFFVAVIAFLQYRKLRKAREAEKREAEKKA